MTDDELVYFCRITFDIPLWLSEKWFEKMGTGARMDEWVMREKRHLTNILIQDVRDEVDGKNFKDVVVEYLP